MHSRDWKAFTTRFDARSTVYQRSLSALWRNSRWSVYFRRSAAAPSPTLPTHTCRSWRRPLNGRLASISRLSFGPGTDSVPFLRSGIPIPMSQWISAAISRWERSSDNRCGRSSPPPLIYHLDACCPVSAAINSWWPCLSWCCISGMEQPTTCHPNCFILHFLSATTENTSV